MFLKTLKDWHLKKKKDFSNSLSGTLWFHWTQSQLWTCWTFLFFCLQLLMHPLLSPIMFKQKLSNGSRSELHIYRIHALFSCSRCWCEPCTQWGLESLLCAYGFMEPNCHCCPSMNVLFVSQIDNCQRRTALAHCVLSAIKSATLTSSDEREGMGESGREMGRIPMWLLPKRIFFFHGWVKSFSFAHKTYKTKLKKNLVLLSTNQTFNRSN